MKYKVKFYLGRSERKNTRSVFYKSKTFALCKHRVVATLRERAENNCQLYARCRKLPFPKKMAG
jgi:hypothetical protein